MMISFLKLIRYKDLFLVLLMMVLTKYALIDSIFFSNISFKSYTIIHTRYLGITLTHYQFILFALSILLVTAGGFIINDIYTIKAASINQPQKVLVKESISIKKAWILYFLISFLGLILGSYLSYITENKEFSFFYLGIILILFLYSRYLKKRLIISNLLSSVLLGLIILITVLFNEPKAHSSNLVEVISDFGTSLGLFLITIGYISFIILTNFINEIMKDIENVNGDIKIKAKTLPILIGRKRASNVAFFFSAILFVLLLIYLKTLNDAFEYVQLIYGIVFIILPLGYFLYKLWFAETKKDFYRLSFLMKIIMFFGILSMILLRIK